MSKDKLSALTEILDNMNRRGGFSASVISGDDGLVVAEASSAENKQVIAAMASLAHSTAMRVKDQIGLGDLEQVTIETTDGIIIFKSVETPRKRLILATILPVSAKRRLVDAASVLFFKDRRYERIVDDAVKEIQSVFSE
ncbi:MAG: roadblock/LC7 domain-containing protein [Candidatus Freyarchaeota archaeon]|nr:roadblock/LC7 domain-containing protein [Candidatus Freyrarchaeum guaymaensis]